MAGYPDDLRYTESHAWLRARETVATFGVTEVLTGRLGAIGFAELPYPGEIFRPGAVVCRLSSDEGSAALTMPVTVKITEVNRALSDDASPIAGDPYGAGWIARIEPGDMAEVEALMDAAAYAAFVEAAGE